MSEKPIVREIALGECGSEFFQQQRINHSKTGFVLDLPGEVIRCRGNTLFAYPDAAVVVNDEGEGRRSAWMSSHVEDTNELIRMIHTLGAELDRTLIGGFAVRLGVHSAIGEILDSLGLAQKCDCGGEPRSPVLDFPGNLKVGFADKAGTHWSWSEPVTARIIATPFPASKTRTDGGDSTAVAVGPNATACYGSKRMTWNGWLPEIYTVCVGRCSSGDCCIRRTKAGTCVKTENGWHSCSCI